MAEYYGVEPKYVGKNNADNEVSTAAVTSNADGTLLERLEWVQATLGSAAGQLRTVFSDSEAVEENAIQYFNIGIFDMDAGAIASASIDITSISAVLQKSTGGGAFSTSSITQPTFSKANGSVYCAYQFLAAEWVTGDMYKLVVGGITATIGSTTAYVPTGVWSNVVVETADLDSNVEYIVGVVDDLHTDIGTAISNIGSVAAVVADLHDVDLPAVKTETGLIFLNTEYLSATADTGTTYPTKVLDNSILSILMTKDSGGDTSDFNNSTDSLEAMSDKLGAFSGDGGANQDDSVKASLDLAHTDLDTLITDTEKIYDVTLGVAPVDGSLASFVATGGTALGTRLPASTSLYDTVKNISTVGVTGAPVSATLSDILHKDGSFTYDNTTDSLEAISDAITSGTFSVTADSGTASTVVDATYGAYGNDYFNGALLVCASGTNVGQARPVNDFTTTSGTFTVSPPFASAVVATDTFLLVSGWKMPEWVPVAATAINATAVVSPGVDLLDLVDTDNKETYKLNNLRIKCADPGANKVTITLYELINGVSTLVDTFEITTDNYTTYFSLFDMFGLTHVSGDDITVNATASAGSYAITGNYQYDISYNA